MARFLRIGFKYININNIHTITRYTDCITFTMMAQGEWVLMLGSGGSSTPNRELLKKSDNPEEFERISRLLDRLEIDFKTESDKSESPDLK
jgi:hypothetical protein